MDIEALEKVGPNYSVEKLLSARRKTTEAVLRIAEKIKPGMLEEDARTSVKRPLRNSAPAKVGIRPWFDSGEIPRRIMLTRRNLMCASRTTTSSSSM